MILNGVMIMNRYMVFGGDYYYAQGGMNDYIGETNYISLALAEGLSFLKSGSFRWVHIYDTEKRKIIAGTVSQSHNTDDLKKKDLIYTYWRCGDWEVTRVDNEDEDI